MRDGGDDLKSRIDFGIGGRKDKDFTGDHLTTCFISWSINT